MVLLPGEARTETSNFIRSKLKPVWIKIVSYSIGSKQELEEEKQHVECMEC